MRLYRLQTGRVRPKAHQIRRARGRTPSIARVLVGREWSEWLPIYAWAIEHPDGVIVVDTGETARTADPGYLPQWQLGFSPETDVRTVVMTHLHPDHAHFPNSEILIHEMEFLAARSVAGKLAGYLPHRSPEWLSPTLLTLPERPFGPFTLSMPLTTDEKIHLVGTPGHTAGHVSVVAEIGGLNYFLAGDTPYNQRNMLEGVPDGVASNDAPGTLRQVREFTGHHPTVYLPSHDPGGPDRMGAERIVPLGGRSPDPSP